MKKQEIIPIVANAILARLEEGIVPWHCPYEVAAEGGATQAASYATGKPYSLLNQLMLPGPGYYLTYGMAKKAGGFVKPGEKGHTVIFTDYKELTETVINEDGTVEEKKRVLFIYKPSTVFHESQCEGIRPRKAAAEAKDLCAPEKDTDCEELIHGYLEEEGITLLTGDAPCYNVSDDTITMPPMSRFESPEAYYECLFHELIHSTGRSNRLDRKMDGGKGSKPHCYEELVAEIGSAAVCSEMDIVTRELFDNSVGYIRYWIDTIKANPAIVLDAAGSAARAVKYILPEKEAESASKEEACTAAA